MSGIVKGIKKVFKAVAKVVKKVAPIALAVGALVFTGGAALGLPGILGGGWGAAAGAVGQAIGGSGVIGSVLTGAIQQAGTSALIGGALSAATGGSFTEGAKAGAAAGAIMGGVGSGLSAMRGPAPAGGPTQPAPGGTPGGPPGGPPTSGSTAIMPGEPGMSVPGGGGVINAGQPRRGLLSKIGGYIERNPDLVGNVVKGVGQGLVAEAGADAERDLLRERRRLISENYAGADPGANYRSLSPGRSGLSAAERFSPDYYQSFEYRYDPQQGRIVRAPRQSG